MPIRTDIAELGRFLRERADANPLPPGVGSIDGAVSGHLQRLPDQFIEHAGETVGANCTRMGLEPGLCVYIAFVTSTPLASDATCAAVCHSIWAGNWSPGLANRNTRWFIRVRRLTPTCPQCGFPNERTDDDGPTMACSECGHEFDV